MVQVVVLSANGESRTLKTAAITAATGESVAKALRKARAAECIGAYTWKEQMLGMWGWREGKAGTENKHELPPPHDEVLLFGDVVVCSDTGDFTVEQWKDFYDTAFGGFEQIGDGEEDEEADVDVDVDVDVGVEEDEVEADVEEDVEDEAEEDDDETVEEEEDEEIDAADDDCYEDGDDGGGGKRRAPRRRTTTAPEYRRMDMGLRSRVKIPTPIGKRAPRWQTATELEAEPYTDE
jgi:hypothetical protein